VKFILKKKTRKTEKKQKKFKIDAWKLSTLVLGFLVVILIISKGPAEVATSDPQTVAQNAVNYINENLLQGQTATLESVEEENGLYKINISIDGTNFASYVSKDGKLLFPTTIELIETSETQAQQPTQDIAKTEKPNVKFFIMAFCPFGQQTESGLEPVFNLLGDKIEMEPHYVIYSNYASQRGAASLDYCLTEEENYCSMHGTGELNEDIRQLCIDKYYDSSTWWTYVMKINEKCSSGDVDTCWESIAKESGIDTEKIKTCQSEEAADLLKIEKSLNDEYEVSGSPTIFINNELHKGGRSSADFQTAICNAFITSPEECSGEINSPSVQQTAPTQGCG
jgi:glutaredoxin